MICQRENRRMKPVKYFKLWLLIGLLASSTVSLMLLLRVQGQQPAFEVKAHYMKSEYQVPMRDGLKLFTVVYAPKDSSKKYPIMFNRTTYSVGPYGPDSFKAAIGPSVQMEIGRASCRERV